MQGYISDVRVTKGIARYSNLPTFMQRLHVLWVAIKYFFTGEGMYLTDGMKVNVGTNYGITYEHWIKPSGATKWEHWSLTFDGKKAVGYIDGKDVSKEG